MHVLNLDPKFKIKGFELPFESFSFSGGEAHIKLQKAGEHSIEKVLITHRINSGQNLMEVLLAADAVRRKYQSIELEGLFPYFPYGRQDRPMIEGEPFSLKVFANVLQTAGFNKIHTLDPHSDVTPALMDNLVILEPSYLRQAKEDILKNYGEFILIAPDGGALKKIYQEAKFIDYKGEIFSATKHRDINNGKITSTKVPELYYGDGTFWIMDDILDGGRTFIELAKILKRREAKHVVLSVSHAIVSHGEEELEKYIDKIYTTNSIKDEESGLIKRFVI